MSEYHITQRDESLCIRWEEPSDVSVTASLFVHSECAETTQRTYLQQIVCLRTVTLSKYNFH